MKKLKLKKAYKKESVQSRFMKFVMRIVPMNKKWNLSGDDLLSYVDRIQKKNRDDLFMKLFTNQKVTKEEINGWTYYVMKPNRGKSKKHILYIHGGGFIYEMAIVHFLFLNKLCIKTKATILIPQYPLAPKYHYDDVLGMLYPLYEGIIKNVDPIDVTIMGDSAGGGITLSLINSLKDKGLPQPKDAIVISPAVDMNFNNAQMSKIERHEYIIGIPALRTLARWYIGNGDVNDYLVSPINATYEDVCNITVFIGTHDVLYPDVRRFRKVLQNKGVKFRYYEYPKMVHIWVLMPIPEGRVALNKICEIINK